jgi:hypothetical protein
MLVEQLKPQLVRPPVAVGPADAGDVMERAFAIFSHPLSPFVFGFPERVAFMIGCFDS